VPVPQLGDNRCIDVSRDGERLAVVLKAPEAQAGKQDTITFFFNFTDELRRVAPGKEVNQLGVSRVRSPNSFTAPP